MTTAHSQTPGVGAAEATVTRLGSGLARYGLVVVIGWIGLLKFTSYEAKGIESLIKYSPLMNWVYDFFSVTTFSMVLGGVEVGAAVLLAIKPWWPKLSAVGSVIAIVLFVATISLLFTTPGIGEASAGGFPLLSMTGQFLIKDVALLGISTWTLADALNASRIHKNAAYGAQPRRHSRTPRQPPHEVTGRQ